MFDILLVMPVDMRPFSAVLERVFSGVQTLHGVQLRYKDVDDRLRLAMPRKLVEHLHPRCMAIKGERVDGRQRCVRRCGIDDLLRRDRSRRTRPISCHGGCHDLCCPVHIDGRLVGFLSIGPFRRGDGPADLPSEPSGIEAIVDLLLEIVSRLGRERALERGRLYDQQLHPALRRLSALLPDCDHDTSASGIASLCGVSCSRLQHLTREQCDASLQTLRDRALLKRAQDLLRDPPAAIGGVARTLGFRDQRYFATWFKRLTGLAPGAWRQEQAERDDA
ncbi:MAG: helix-turn-helix domain-containing protein [Planctomycetota bacterium]